MRWAVLSSSQHHSQGASDRATRCGGRGFAWKSGPKQFGTDRLFGVREGTQQAGAPRPPCSPPGLVGLSTPAAIGGPCTIRPLFCLGLHQIQRVWASQRRVSPWGLPALSPPGFTSCQAAEVPSSPPTPEPEPTPGDTTAWSFPRPHAQTAYLVAGVAYWTAVSLVVALARQPAVADAAGEAVRVVLLPHGLDGRCPGGYGFVAKGADICKEGGHHGTGTGGSSQAKPPAPEVPVSAPREKTKPRGPGTSHGGWESHR